MNAEYTLPKFLSSEAKDMIKNIFLTNPEERFGIEEIRNHPWYKLSQPEAPSFNSAWTANSINHKIVQTLE